MYLRGGGGLMTDYFKTGTSLVEGKMSNPTKLDLSPRRNPKPLNPKP